MPANNKVPVLASQPNACELSWDLSQAVAGQRYVLHIIYESTHDGQISSTALDLIVEIVTPPPPTPKLPGSTGSGSPHATMVSERKLERTAPKRSEGSSSSDSASGRSERIECLECR